MDTLRQYLMSIVITVVICSILSSLVQSDVGKELFRIACGVSLSITILSPLCRIGPIERLTLSIPNPDTVLQEGKEMAQEALSQCIKEETQAYILEKAKHWKADVLVDVEIDDNRIPCRVILSGKVSPYTRRQMEQMLETDIGITKENQIWTG